MEFASVIASMVVHHITRLKRDAYTMGDKRNMDTGRGPVPSGAQFKHKFTSCLRSRLDLTSSVCCQFDSLISFPAALV